MDADAGVEQCSLSWAEVATALVLPSASPCLLITAPATAVQIVPALHRLLCSGSCVLERVQHSPALCLPFPEWLWMALEEEGGVECHGLGVKCWPELLDGWAELVLQAGAPP